MSTGFLVRKHRGAAIGALLCFLVAAAVFVTVRWYTDNFDTSLAGLLFTLTIPQKGTGVSAVAEPFKIIAPVVLQYTGGYLLALLLCSLTRLQLYRPVRLIRTGLIWIGYLSILSSLLYTFFDLDVPEYIARANDQTTIYEEEYVAPASVALTPPGERPNLICLYLESMETTYASEEEGGVQPVNYMPQLTRLAAENISFSNTDRLGGFHSTDNTNWTMAALFASTSGLPFAFPVAQNSLGKYTSIAPNLTTLGDLLEKEGYAQEFLCGSDGEYGGRALYFRGHGNYEIYDLWKAREMGDIPEDYYEWWGFEDRILFRIARQELTRLWKAGEPFNLTLLTVDAHHLGGFLCEECGSEFEDKTANVIACTDRQVAEFVDWCRQQPFWDSTVMVISGDHPRMDTCLTEDVPFLDRTIYNCILNSRKEPAGGTTYREATIMDLFPTTLSAMGWEIEGDRLGLGTDLLSVSRTLAERKGIETVNDELMKYSRYFVNHFAK